MVLTFQRQLIVGLLLGGLLISLPVAAQKYRSPEGQSYNRSSQREDLDSAVERIRRETGGRVLHAETRENAGQQEHRVRIITDQGKVRRYRIDAGSGQELSPRERRR
jgi:uncharacterized membrane protein YkoI